MIKIMGIICIQLFTFLLVSYALRCGCKGPPERWGFDTWVFALALAVFFPFGLIFSGWTFLEASWPALIKERELLTKKKSVWLHKLFCKHVWDTTKIRPLPRTKNVSCVGGAIDIDYWDNEVRYQRCLKCPKTRIIEVHKLTLPF